MTLWYLARHGQTDWNRDGRAQGDADIPLNARGRWQTERLAARLSGAGFAAAYSSDRVRAVETATAVLRGRETPLHPCPELREVSFGEWEGLTYAEVWARDPEGYARYMEGEAAAGPPGGESIGDQVARVGALAARLRERHPQGDLLLVGHAGSVRSLALYLLGLPPDCYWRLTVDQASLSVVSIHTAGAVLELWNDTSHLGEALAPGAAAPEWVGGPEERG